MPNICIFRDRKPTFGTVMKRILLLWSVCLMMISCAPERPGPLNVIVFLVDDLGWSDVGCYGSTFYETPNIDELAGRGVRFTSAYAACHVCSPTRASLITGAGQKMDITFHME